MEDGPGGGVSSAVFGEQGVMVVDDFEVGQLQDVWREDPVVVGTDNESWFGEILK